MAGVAAVVEAEEDHGKVADEGQRLPGEAAVPLQVSYVLQLRTSEICASTPKSLVQQKNGFFYLATC